MSKLTNLDLIDPVKIDARREKNKHLYFTTEETLRRRNEEIMRQRVIGDMIMIHTQCLTDMKKSIENLREEILALKLDVVDYGKMFAKMDKLTSLFK